jgi:hypothetical protein
LWKSRSRHDQGPFPLDEALPLARQIAENNDRCITCVPAVSSLIQNPEAKIRTRFIASQLSTGDKSGAITCHDRGKRVFWWEPTVAGPPRTRGFFDDDSNALSLMTVFDNSRRN